MGKYKTTVVYVSMRIEIILILDISGAPYESYLDNAAYILYIAPLL